MLSTSVFPRVAYLSSIHVKRVQPIAMEYSPHIYPNLDDSVTFDDEGEMNADTDEVRVQKSYKFQEGRSSTVR